MAIVIISLLPIYASSSDGNLRIQLWRCRFENSDMDEDEDKDQFARLPSVLSIAMPDKESPTAAASLSSSSAAASSSSSSLSSSSSSSSSSFPLYGVDRFPASVPLPPLPASPSKSSSCSCRSCIASAAADCAAVCCCPFSILSLIFLACFKIPSAGAARVLTAVKRKWRSQCPCRNHSHEFESSRSCPVQSWSCSNSPIIVPGNSSPACFDNQQLWMHFGLNPAGFGIREDSSSHASN